MVGSVKIIATSGSSTLHAPAEKLHTADAPQYRRVDTRAYLTSDALPTIIHEKI